MEGRNADETGITHTPSIVVRCLVPPAGTPGFNSVLVPLASHGTVGEAVQQWVAQGWLDALLMAAPGTPAKFLLCRARGHVIPSTAPLSMLRDGWVVDVTVSDVRPDRWGSCAVEIAQQQTGAHLAQSDTHADTTAEGLLEGDGIREDTSMPLASPVVVAQQGPLAYLSLSESSDDISSDDTSSDEMSSDDTSSDDSSSESSSTSGDDALTSSDSSSAEEEATADVGEASVLGSEASRLSSTRFALVAEKQPMEDFEEPSQRDEVVGVQSHTESDEPVQQVQSASLLQAFPPTSRGCIEGWKPGCLLRLRFPSTARELIGYDELTSLACCRLPAFVMPQAGDTLVVQTLPPVHTRGDAGSAGVAARTFPARVAPSTVEAQQCYVVPLEVGAFAFATPQSPAQWFPAAVAAPDGSERPAIILQDWSLVVDAWAVDGPSTRKKPAASPTSPAMPAGASTCTPAQGDELPTQPPARVGGRKRRRHSRGYHSVAAKRTMGVGAFLSAGKSS